MRICQLSQCPEERSFVAAAQVDTNPNTSHVQSTAERLNEVLGDHNASHMQDFSIPTGTTVSPLSNATFSYMHNANLIEDSLLDGVADTSSHIRFITEHLRESAQSEAASEQIELLEGAVVIQNRLDALRSSRIATITTALKVLASDISSQIENLQEGKSILIPGGWNQSGALYKITKTGDTYSLWVYNTGEGVSENHPSIEDGAKTKFAPCYKIEGISPNKIHNKDFLRALLELKLFAQTRYSGEVNYDSSMLYTRLLPSLEGTVVRTEPSANKYVTLRHTQVSAYKSITAFLRDSMRREDYLLWKFAMKKESFFRFYHENKNSLSEDETARVLLSTASEKMARTALKLYESRILSREDLSGIRSAFAAITAECLQAQRIAGERALVQQTDLGQTIPEQSYSQNRSWLSNRDITLLVEGLLPLNLHKVSTTLVLGAVKVYQNTVYWVSRICRIALQALSYLPGAYFIMKRIAEPLLYHTSHFLRKFVSNLDSIVWDAVDPLTFSTESLRVASIERSSLVAPTAETLKASLESWVNQAKEMASIRGTDPQKLAIFINDVVTLIPIVGPESLLMQVPEGEIESCTQSFMELSQVLVYARSKESERYPKDYLSFYTLQAATDQLARRKCENHLEGFTPFGDDYFDLSGAAFFRLFDPIDEQRLQKIKDYAAAIDEGRVICLDQYDIRHTVELEGSYFVSGGEECAFVIQHDQIPDLNLGLNVTNRSESPFLVHYQAFLADPAVQRALGPDCTDSRETLYALYADLGDKDILPKSFTHMRQQALLMRQFLLSPLACRHDFTDGLPFTFLKIENTTCGTENINDRPWNPDLDAAFSLISQNFHSTNELASRNQWVLSCPELATELEGLHAGAIRRNYWDRYNQFDLEDDEASTNNFHREFFRTCSLPQNTLMIQNASHSLPLERFRDLSLLDSEELLQVTQCLSYYNEHISDLDDPEERLCLELRLFKHGLITDQLRHCPHLISQFNAFIERALARFEAHEKLDTCAFFIRQAQRMRRYVADACPDSNLPVIDTRAWILDKLHHLDADTNPKVRSALYAALILDYKEAAELSNDDIKILLRAKAYTSIWNTAKDKLLDAEIVGVMSNLAEHIKVRLNASNDLQQNILQDVFSLSGITGVELHSWTGNCPIYEDSTGRYIVDLLAGKIYQDGMMIGQLPVQITKTTLFQKLFGKKDFLAHAGTVGYNTPAYYFKEDTWRVSWEPSATQYVFEKKINGHWYRYLPLEKNGIESDDYSIFEASTYYSHISNKHFETRYTHWIATEFLAEDHVLIMDQKGETPVAQALLSKSIWGSKYIEKITRLNSSFECEQLDLVNISCEYNTSILQCFTDIEEPEHIIAWKKTACFSGNIQRLEFPRLDLSFTAAEDDEYRLNCDQYSGFYLDPNQHLSAIGTFGKFLVLRNDAGDQKVLFPAKEIDEKFSRRNPRVALNTDYDYKHKGDTTTYCYDYCPETSTLKSDDAHANLYLAYLSITFRRYDDARLYLEGASSMRRLTEQEKQVLKWIMRVHRVNHDPRATSLILEAAVIAIENVTEHPDLIGEDTTLPLDNFDQHLISLFRTRAHAPLAVMGDPAKRQILIQYIEAHGELSHALTRMVNVNTSDPVSSSQHTFVAADYGNPFTDPVLPPEFDLESYSYGARIRSAQCCLLDSDVDPQDYPLTFRGMNHVPHLYAAARGDLGAEATSAIRMRLLTVGNVYTRLYSAVLENPSAFPLMPEDAVNSHDSESYYGHSQFNYFTYSLENLVVSTIRARPALSAQAPIETILCPEFGFSPPRLDRPEIRDDGQLNSVILPSIRPVRSTATLGGFDDYFALDRSEREQIPAFISEDTAATPCLARLDEDIAAWYASEEGAHESHYTLNESNLNTLKTKVLSELENVTQLNDDRTAILDFINALQNDPSVTLGGLGGEFRPNDFNDILLMYLRQDWTKLVRSLTETELAALESCISNYLLRATHHQQFRRLLLTIQEYESVSIPEQKDAIAQKLATELRTQRAYNPEETSRAYLLFEYQSEMILRKKQVDLLARMLSGEEPNLITQLIMGGGKSKILLPILAVLKADGERLPVMVVPASLYETNSQDMAILSRSVFAQQSHTLEITRQTDLNITRLKEIYSSLQRVIRNKQYLVVTAETMQCLQLQYIDCLHQNQAQEAPNSAALELLAAYEKIFHLFHERGDAVLDEADTILNCRSELNFTLQGSETVSPRTLNFVTKIYEYLVSDEELVSLIALRANEQSFMDDEAITRVKNRLAEILCEEQFEINVQDYLCGRTNLIPNILEGHPKKDLIAFAKEQICTLLPLTLNKKGNEHYGLSKVRQYPIAIPYVASNTPNERAEFGTPYEAMNYTCQVYLQDGLNRDHIETLVSDLRKKALDQVDEENIPVTETDASQEFQTIAAGFSLFTLTDEDYNQILENVNNNPIKILNFVRVQILPVLKSYPLKAKSTPANFSEMFASVLGFTGTPWNTSTYHQKFATWHDRGTDGKTVDILCKSAASAEAVKTLDLPDDARAAVRQIFNEYHVGTGDEHALIDCGALFKGVTNTTVAKEMLAYLEEHESEIKGIAFFNEANELVVLESGREEAVPINDSTLKPYERYSYYDQRHTIGADIKQTLQAKAIVTISEKLFLKDLLQAVWRMRGLADSQSVRFLVPRKVHDVISSNTELSIRDLIIFAAKAQEERLLDDNFRSSKQRFINTIRERVFRQIIAETASWERKQALFTQAANLFVSSEETDVYQLFSPVYTEGAPLDALQNFIDNFYERVPELAALCPTLFDDLPDFPDAEEMPETVLISETDAFERDVQTEQEIEQEVDIELEVVPRRLSAIYRAHTSVNWTDSLNPYADDFTAEEMIEEAISTADTTRLRPAVYTIAHVSEQVPSLVSEDLTDIFDRSIHLSGNFERHIHPSNSGGRWSTPPTELFNLFQKRAYQVLVERTGAEFKITLVDQFDARRITEIFRHTVRPEGSEKSVFLYTPGVGVTQEAGETISQSELDHNAAFQRLMVQVKFFNGHSRFSRSEKVFLEAWIREKGNIKMKNLFGKIIANREVSTVDYSGSALERLFERLEFEATPIVAAS